MTGELEHLEGKLLTRSLTLIACSVLLAASAIALSVVIFNLVIGRSGDDGSIIQLAELELKRRGLPKCKDQSEDHKENADFVTLPCRWWRLPNNKGKYCGRVSELLKMSENCLEIAFDSKTPTNIRETFLITFENPCILIENHKREILYSSLHMKLKCKKGNQFRRFSIHYIVLNSNAFKRPSLDFDRDEPLDVVEIRRSS